MGFWHGIGSGLWSSAREVGHFVWHNPIKAGATAAIAAGVAVTAPIVLTATTVALVGVGSVKIGKAAYKASKAENKEEMKKAGELMGHGMGDIAISALTKGTFGAFQKATVAAAAAKGVKKVGVFVQSLNSLPPGFQKLGLVKKVLYAFGAHNVENLQNADTIVGATQAAVDLVDVGGIARPRLGINPLTKAVLPEPIEVKLDSRPDGDLRKPPKDGGKPTFKSSAVTPLRPLAI